MNVNPFSPVIPKRTLKFYAFWAVSLLISPILVPIRVVLLVFICMFNSVQMRFVAKGINPRKPLNPIRQGILQAFTRSNAKFFLRVLGVRIVEVDAYKRPLPQTTNVLIFNHTSSLDPVVLETFDFVSFVSKAEVAKMPVFGVSAKANYCIFFERSKEGDSERVFEEVKQRISDDVQQFGYPRRFPPLCIAPEGTVCNGQALLPFKRGAFTGGCSIYACTIKWDQQYGDMCDACISKAKVAMKLVFGLFQTVTVQWLGEYVPNEAELVDWYVYAQNVRSLYSKALQIPVSEYSPYDKQYYAGKAGNYAKCSAAWKLDHSENDVLRKSSQTKAKKQD